MQKVIDQDHADHRAEHEARLKERLDAAVKDGKLTQEQETKLLAKVKELADLKATLQDKTPQERRTTMRAKMDELKQWLQDNNIPEAYWHLGHGGPGGFGRGGHSGVPPPNSGTSDTRQY